MKEHFYDMKSERRRNFLIYQKMNEYGKDEVESEILEGSITDKELLNEREKYWINKLNSLNINNPYGLNTNYGGFQRFNDDVVYNIKKDFAEGYSRKKLKYKYCIDSVNLSSILTKNNWSNVGKEYNEIIEKRILEERKLVKNNKNNIRNDYLRGKSVEFLAEKYDYSIHTISKIVGDLGNPNMEKLILGIKRDFIASYSREEIAKKYGVKRRFVIRVLTLDIYSYIGEELNSKITKLRNIEKPDSFESTMTNDLKVEIVTNIKKKFISGLSKKEIANMYNVNLRFVNNILNLKRNVKIAKELNEQIINIINSEKGLSDDEKEYLAILIKQDFIKGMTRKELAVKYNVKPSFVSGIIELKTYTKIAPELNDMILSLRKSKNEIIKQIKIDYVDGMTISDIVRKYSVGRGFVNGIVNLKAHVGLREDLNEKILNRRNKNK